MRITILVGILSLFFSTTAFASENWLCTEDSAQRNGHIIIACGAGLGKTEGDAREDAAFRAKKEFNAICEQSLECRGHETEVEPTRSTCEPIGGGFTRCYRGFRYQVLEEMKPVQERKLASIEEVAKIPETPSKDWNLLLGFAYMSNPGGYTAPSKVTCCGVFDASIERKFLGPLSAGIKLSIFASSSESGSGSTTTASGPFTTGVQISAIFPIEIVSGFSLIPNIGKTAGSDTSGNSIQSYFAGGQARFSFDIEKSMKFYFYASDIQNFGGASGNSAGGGLGLAFGF